MLIKNVNVITLNEILYGYDVDINDGKIINIAKNIDGKAQIDGKGQFLSPGFVDIHIHGGGGADFCDNDDNAYSKITYTHMIHGTTSLVPTLLPSNYEDMKKMIIRYNNAKDYHTNLLGIHLEGPYINPKQAGAINKEYLRDINIEEIKEIIDIANGSIARVTIAPELKNAIEAIRLLKQNDICVSIGHSNATFDETKKAFDIGANLITHLYSACSSITRVNGYRVCGIVEAAYLIDDLDIEIIADGAHLPLDLLKYICKFKKIDNIILVSDAMRAAGTNDKISFLGVKGAETKCIIEDGVAKLCDRSAFAGSIATSDLLIKTMLKAGINLVDAIKMITANPIKTLGNRYLKGQIKVGYDADLVLFDEDINISTVIINGDIVYKK